MVIEYFQIRKFKKEFKKLKKKYKTLHTDLENVKRFAIEMLHIQNINNNSCFRIPGFKSYHCEIYKIKKFACKALKGRGKNSGIRIIYAYFPEKKQVHFIEIYFKGNKENEDKERIEEFIKEYCEND